jgi:predicted RNase H-like HicB family nuclease
MANYIALIRKDPDSDYSVNFPDFPGCITAGSTVDEAKDMAAEALALHIKGMVEDGDAVPKPSDLEAIMRDPDNRDSVAFLVEPPVVDTIVRVNVTFKSSTLREIDEAARVRGLTRSAFLADAALSRAAETVDA